MAERARRSSVLAWTVVTTVLGAMMAVQYHDVLLGGTAIWTALPGVETVQSRLSAVQVYNRSLQDRITRLNRQMTVLQARTVARGGEAAHLARRLHSDRVLTGATALVGPGVVVTINDGRVKGANLEQFLTHDWDLRSVINELFLAGADAVAINGARVTATTGVFCIGPLVRVGRDRLGPPFVVRAIGDPPLLRDALALPGGVLDALRSANRGLAVSQPVIRAQVAIPAAGGRGGSGGAFG